MAHDPSGQHLVRGHAEEVVNPAAVLSHQTAAVAWRLPQPGFAAWSGSPVAVTVPAGADFANPRPVQASRRRLLDAAGVRRLSLTAAINRCDPGRESPAESLSAGWFAVAGIPTPLFQPPVDSSFGTLYPDCLWPEARLVGECDGAVKYVKANAYVNEKEREQVLRDLDFRIVRWLAKEIMLDPQRVVDRVARALAAS